MQIHVKTGRNRSHNRAGEQEGHRERGGEQRPILEPSALLPYVALLLQQWALICLSVETIPQDRGYADAAVLPHNDLFRLVYTGVE